MRTNQKIYIPPYPQWGSQLPVNNIMFEYYLYVLYTYTNIYVTDHNIPYKPSWIKSPITGHVIFLEFSHFYVTNNNNHFIIPSMTPQCPLKRYHVSQPQTPLRSRLFTSDLVCNNKESPSISLEYHHFLDTSVYFSLRFLIQSTIPPVTIVIVEDYRG